MLIPLRPILDATEKYDYAQGAFNVNAVCQAKAVIEVHEMFRSPAILQGADLANGFMGGRTDFMNATVEDKIKGARNIADAVRRFAVDSPIPVALHLDHGNACGTSGSSSLPSASSLIDSSISPAGAGSAASEHAMNMKPERNNKVFSNCRIIYILIKTVTV